MARPKGSKNKPRAWGDMFYLYLGRGYDHGYAAHLADEWERRKKRNQALGRESRYVPKPIKQAGS